MPVLVGLRRCCRRSCTRAKVSRSMMAGWVSGKIFHSSWGLSSRFFNLKDCLNERKFTVSPVYSCLSRIAATVEEHQLCGYTGGLTGHFTPTLCRYSLGVITPSDFSRLAICVGPRPDTLIRKIRCTTSAAGSSTIHLFLSSGSFL